MIEDLTPQPDKPGRIDNEDTMAPINDEMHIVYSSHFGSNYNIHFIANEQFPEALKIAEEIHDIASEFGDSQQRALRHVFGRITGRIPIYSQVGYRNLAELSDILNATREIATFTGITYTDAIKSSFAPAPYYPTSTKLETILDKYIGSYGKHLIIKKG